MKMKSKGSSIPFKHNNLTLKIVVSFLLAGFTFNFLFCHSPMCITNEGIVTERETETGPFVGIVGGPAKPGSNPSVNVNVSTTQDGDDKVSSEVPAQDLIEPTYNSERCDLFTGDWVPSPSGPVYTNASCPFIEDFVNCMRKGRLDTGYWYWRWKPKQCELPPFDPKRFLLLMRNKTWAMIGDSISRNHAQSLICILATVERPQKAYDFYKSSRWIFPSYNFTLSVIWSPFLAEVEKFDTPPATEIVHLDKLDKEWTYLYPYLDYMVISVGPWFLKSSIYYENDKVVGCNICNWENITHVGFDFAYKRVIQDVLNFIATSKHRGAIFFRTSAPDHYENGEWNTGGTCVRTAPVKDGEIKVNDWWNRIFLSEFDAALKKATKNGVNLRLLDIRKLMSVRPDGHPGPYRFYYPFAKDKNAKVHNDCIHWCLPGPIDYWNDMILEMLVNPNRMMGTIS